MVVVGEAGIGKTALVAVGLRGASGAPRALGRVRPARSRRARWARCATSARDAGGPLPAALDGRRLARGASSPPRSTSWPARGRSSSSRTCTGPTTRRSTSSRSSDGGSCAPAAACSSPAGSEALTERPEVRRVLAGAVPPEVPAPHRAGAALARRPSRCSPRRAGRRRVGPARGLGRQPVLRHRGARRARRGAVPASVRDAVPCASARSDRRRARSSSSPPSSRARPSWACSPTRSAASAAAIDACIARASSPSAATPSPSATTSPAGRSRSEICPARRRELDRIVLRRAGGDRRRRSRPPRPPRPPRGRHRGDPPARARRRARGERARAATGQALEHWEAALAADARPPEALEGVSVEGYLCGELERAARGAARAAAHPRGRRASPPRRRRPALAVAHPVVAGEGARRPRPATGRSRCSRRSPRAASWRWR